jgi:hypothetical protein
MKGKLYRVGDLVLHCIGYDNGWSINIYCKIENIISKQGESYSEYDVITGHGDLNSKVDIVIKPLVYCKDLSPCDLDRITSDCRDVHIRHPDEEIKILQKKIDFLQKEIDFFNINENRIDKLNKVLYVPE